MGMEVLKGKSDNCVYSGHRFAFLNQHGREAPVADVLESILGCVVTRIGGFDTDRLGSFTRETSRRGDQLEAARTKARLGIRPAGTAFGLGSEGTFAPHPLFSSIYLNRELLILVDRERKIKIVEVSEAIGRFRIGTINGLEAVKSFTAAAGFPEHHLVVRPDGSFNVLFRNGVLTWPELKSAFTWAVAIFPTGSAFIGTDVRAFANPTRMENIRREASDLAAKLISECPQCRLPAISSAIHALYLAAKRAY